jgi:peptidoglycan hydrolase CwlO-like protein
MAGPRTGNLSASRIGGTDDRRRVRELEQLLEAKHIDLAVERKKLINEFEREKRLLLNENADLREEVENLQGEFDFQRAQLNKEIESLNDEIEQLTKEINDRNEILGEQERLLASLETEQNSDQIQECLANIKSIFDRDGREDRNLESMAGVQDPNE